MTKLLFGRWTANSPSWNRFVFLIVVVAGLFQAVQGRTYQVMQADVPFKFAIASQSFRPGHYEFIFVGNGLLVVRDDHKHVVTSIITRSISSKAPLPQTKLVFKTEKQQRKLSEIWVANTNAVLEVMGEDVAIRQSVPQLPPATPLVIDSLLGRTDSPRLRY